MNYIIHYEYAATGIILFTVFFLITRKDLKKAENRILLLLSVLNLVSAIADIIAYTVQMDIPRFGIPAATFWNELHLIIHTQMGFFLVIYILELLGIRKKLKKWQWAVIGVPSLLLIVVLVLNPWLHWYFYYNEANIYSYGPMTPVIFGVPLFHITVALFLTIRYRGVLQRRMLLAMCVFFVLVFAAVIVQFLFHELLIEMYAEALGILGATLALENKDELHLLVESMDRLEEERQRAEAANRSKSDFLANMSHEIRTPINAVLGMNEMAMREASQAAEDLAHGHAAKEETFRRLLLYTGDIRSAGQNLLAIINDILDFSKIESGKMELVTGNFKLSSVLNDVSNMILFRANAKQLAFHVDVDETLPDGLFGDEVRVRQVMTNVLNNAVKYTERGSVTMRVRCETDPFLLVCAVEDTGIGIREADIEKLFSKFSRIDVERNKTIEGTGLGLAITQNLLRMMNGTIDVQSEYGKGSVFTLRIPLTVTDPSPVGDFRKRFEEGIRESAGYRESFRAPEARILVVDDTPVNLTVIKGLLSETQVKINTATGGAQALEMTADIPFDLILMDQRMPQMDGTQTLHHLQEQTDGANAGTPVICLTADVVQGARDRYLGEGFTDYLSKPVEGAQLEALLMKYLPEEKVEVVKTAKREDAPVLSAQPAALPAPAEPASDPGPRTPSDARQIIEAETPQLLQAYRAMAGTLRQVFGFPEIRTDGGAEADKPDIGAEELRELYDAVLEFAEGYDIDSIDAILEQAKEYRIPDCEKERYGILLDSVRASDWDRLKEVLAE